MDWKIEASSLRLRRPFGILNKQQTSTAIKLLTLQGNLTDLLTACSMWIYI